MSEDQTPFEILSDWAWCKVNLKDVQERGNQSEVESAIVAYRHALRKKKQLDEAYAWHHELLMMFTTSKP